MPHLHSQAAFPETFPELHSEKKKTPKICNSDVAGYFARLVYSELDAG